MRYKESASSELARHVEARLTRHLDSLGQGTSRRGVLASLCRAIASAIGLRLAVAVPVDRLVAQDQCQCNSPELCGICGRLCDKCAGGNCGSCPSGSSLGGYWTKCCAGVIIGYYDCCVSGTLPSCCSEGTPCCPGGSQYAWCYPGTRYCCTVRSYLGQCPI